MIYLGPNLPTEDLIQAIRSTRPQMVLLSTSTLAGADRMIAAVDKIRSDTARAREKAAPEVPLPFIGYGGRVFETHPERQERIAGVFLGVDLAAALVQIDALMAGAAHPGTA
jgi:hypothetical protein